MTAAAAGLGGLTGTRQAAAARRRTALGKTAPAETRAAGRPQLMRRPEGQAAAEEGRG